MTVNEIEEKLAFNRACQDNWFRTIRGVEEHIISASRVGMSLPALQATWENAWAHVDELLEYERELMDALLSPKAKPVAPNTKPKVSQRKKK